MLRADCALDLLGLLCLSSPPPGNFLSLENTAVEWGANSSGAAFLVEGNSFSANTIVETVAGIALGGMSNTNMAAGVSGGDGGGGSLRITDNIFTLKTTNTNNVGGLFGLRLSGDWRSEVSTAMVGASGRGIGFFFEGNLIRLARPSSSAPPLRRRRHSRRRRHRNGLFNCSEPLYK